MYTKSDLEDSFQFLCLWLNVPALRFEKLVGITVTVCLEMLSFRFPVQIVIDGAVIKVSNAYFVNFGIYVAIWHKRIDV